MNQSVNKIFSRTNNKNEQKQEDAKAVIEGTKEGGEGYEDKSWAYSLVSDIYFIFRKDNIKLFAMHI